MNKVIEIKNLSFVYPGGKRALENVSLEVCAAEALGIIGPNGAGKSTLLLHFNGLLNASKAVSIFGRPVNKKNLSFIRQKVGFVFQDPHDQLFMPTVYEDVAFGPKNLGLSEEEVKKNVEDALTRVGLLGLEKELSYHLSLGQQRRLSIATVLAMAPEILVLDEPNANLDPASRRHLINFLKPLPITKIIATHDLEMILELCQQVLLLDEGKIVSGGETKKILSDRSLLEAHGLEVPLSIALTNLPL